MLMAAVLGWAVLARVPWPVVAFLGAATIDPVPAALVLAAVAFLFGARPWTRQTLADEAAFHAAVAAELRSGASLRMALVEAGRRVPRLLSDEVVRGLRRGSPLHGLATATASALPATGRLFAPAVLVSASAGGRAAGVFDRLALRAADDRALARERRNASAQARLSAWIVGGLPAVGVGLSAAGGRLGPLADGGVGRAVMALGLILVGTGLLSVALILRRSAS